MRTLVNLRFEKGDPVCEYWLARGEGFVLETRNGRVVGQVVDSVFDPERRRVVGLVVRERVLGAVPGPTSEVSADRIAAAVPGREAFVLDGAPEPQQQPAEPKQRRLVPAARAAGNGAAGAVRRIGPLGGRIAGWGRATTPVLRAVASSIAAWAVGVAAWTVLAARALGAEARRTAGDRKSTRLNSSH